MNVILEVLTTLHPLASILVEMKPSTFYRMVLVGHGLARHSMILDDPKAFPASYQTKLIDVNLSGAYNFIKIMGQDLVARGSKGGHILIMGSGAAYSALPANSGYNASKAGVVSLYNSLSIELDYWFKAKNVRTTVFCPLKVSQIKAFLHLLHRQFIPSLDVQILNLPFLFQVESEMTKGRMIDQKNQFLFPTLTVNGVATDIVEALEKDQSGIIYTPATGRALAILSGILPEWVMRANYKSLGATETFVDWYRQNNKKMAADH